MDSIKNVLTDINTETHTHTHIYIYVYILHVSPFIFTPINRHKKYIVYMCVCMRLGSQVRQTFEEGRRTYRSKRCGNNNKEEDNNSKTLNEKHFFISLFYLFVSFSI